MSVQKYTEYINKLGLTTEAYRLGIKRNDETGKITDDGKQQNISDIVMYWLCRCQSMVKHPGLPDTMPERVVNQILQANGCGLAAEMDGNWYFFTGGLGGPPDVNYNPTVFTVSNPALGKSKQYRINDWKSVKNTTIFDNMPDGVLIRHDSYCMGLLPLLRKYATLLAENELSIWMATINSRILSYLAASDDNTKASAQKYLDDMIDGNLGVIGQNAFLQGIATQPNANAATAGIMQGLIENEQYLKGSLANDLGLNANFNMKREALNSAESGLNNDMLLPFVDDIINTQAEDWKKFSELSGHETTAELGSSWEDNEQEVALFHEQIEATGEPLDETHEETPEEEEVKAAEEEGKNNDISDAE